MNCRDFQDELFEFLDGTLSPDKRAGAERHLMECGACREAVRQHQQWAQSLPARFRQNSMPGAAPRSEAAHRVGACGQGQRAGGGASAPGDLALDRLAHGHRGGAAHRGRIESRGPLRGRVQKAETARRPAPAVISIRVLYCDPTYTFRRENNQVIDALTCTPHVVEENLSLSLDQNPVPQTQERKTPL